MRAAAVINHGNVLESQIKSEARPQPPIHRQPSNHHTTHKLKMIRSFSKLAVFIYLLFSPAIAPAQPTAFTYQGRLTASGTPFTGSAEFQFTLWDAASGGSVVATNNPSDLVAPVSNGLFTVELDFGEEAFDRSGRFLQIEVRTTIGSFTTLSPRQRITPSPEAIHATSADTAAEARTVDVGTIHNPTFIGTTTTNVPLDLFANNQRVLRLEDSGADTNNDGTLHAAYSEIIPLLVEAVKEHNRKSEARSQRSEACMRNLEAENTELKARLEKLEERVHALAH